jgi:glycosyltransferase involved in cell wall biosynthesis
LAGWSKPCILWSNRGTINLQEDYPLKPQLIVFGEDWGALPTSTQHIIKQLRPDYRITWINSLGLRSPKASWHDLKRVCNKAARIAKQLLNKKQPPLISAIAANPNAINDEHNFSVVEPQYIPFPGNGLARRINRLLLAKLLRRHSQPASAGQPSIIWISLPNAVDALHYLAKTDLANAVVIYYCCDDFSALDGVDHQAISMLERELAQQADVIVATSPGLVSKFPEHKTHLIPHGVDTRLFYQKSARAIDLPTGKPIAGFYGSIAPWIDLDLLTQLARQMPDWNFVFIGVAKVDVSKLQALSNVFFLGERPHEQLPAYSQHWQASLLPFILNEQIMACNPLKLREYLATGRPIISVDFPQVHNYSEFIHIVDGADGFARALRESLGESNEFADLRQLKVASESWQAVAGRINNLLVAQTQVQPQPITANVH